MGIHNWTLCVLVFVLMKSVSSDKVTACSTQSICITFAVDRTANINGEQRQQMVNFIQGVIPTTPEDSEGHLIYVNKERNEVATFVVENQTATYTYFYGLEDWEPTGYIISAKALEQEVNVCFNTSGYKLKTDVFFLLVSDLTKLQGISPELLWKETFVIVFGSRIPNEFQRLASSEDHTHLIKDSDDVTTAVNIVSKQLCKACSTDPVCVSFAIDRNININEEQQQQMTHLIKDITATIPEGSEGHLIYVNDESNKVATFVVENQNKKFTFFYGQEDWEPTGYIISEIALSQAANMCYTAADNESKADIKFLFVSDLTKLQGFSKALLTKMTFVIVFGSSIPNEFQCLASIEDHIYLIKDSHNVKSVADHISQQVCKDILFPYIHVPDVEVIPKETDSGERTFYFVLGGVGIGIIISFLVLILCRKKKRLCFASKEMVQLVGYKKVILKLFMWPLRIEN